MMQLTLHRGVCNESCYGMSMFSFLLCQYGDFKAADRIGHLSILLLDKCKAEEYRSNIYSCYYGIVRCWNVHIKESLEKLLDGYHVGMQTGNIENAMINALLFLLNSFMCGRNLVELERKLVSFGKIMIEHKQVVTHDIVRLMHLFVSNLLISNESPSLLGGQNTEKNDLLKQATKEHSTFLFCHTYIFASIEAYIFCDYELAANMIEKRKEVEKTMSRKSLYYGVIEFYDGLVFLAMARETNDVKWSLKLSEALSKLESFVQTGKVNCEHKLLLLQAEAKSLLGKNEDALSKYELAIAIAGKNGFVHEQAIANERVGDFFLRNGDSRASQYYGISNILYRQWGAQCKADHLCKSVPF